MEKIKIMYAPINGIDNGGLSTIAFRLGTNMEEDKVTIDFFATYKINNDVYKEKVSKKNGKIFDFDISKDINPVLRKILIMKNFYKVLKQNKYDIIHIHIDTAYLGFLFGIIAKLCTKSKIILHSHSSSTSGKLKYILHNIFKPTLRYIGDEFFTCSTEAANWMYTKHILKNNVIRIVENGIDINPYLYNEDVRNEYRKNLNLSDKFIIGHIGRFSKEKNHEFLIDVFYEIYKKNKNAKLILIGSGKLEEKIKEKVKNLKLENDVLFLGSRNDVNNLLQIFDVFVLPSLYEGLPIVAVEAQASGLNTILSDSITKEAKILPNVKYISLNEGAKKWADEIINLKEINDRLKYKNELLESNFNIKKSALKLQKIYLKMIEEK